MTARLPSDLMDRSAQESSRLLALKYLDQIAQAQCRLEGSLDSEALHDFRVGLRRLRSCVRAYSLQLEGSVTDKMQKRLRRLTRATNSGRDTEVHLTWLRKQAERLETEDTEGLFWLIGRLEGRKDEVLDPATAAVGQRFMKVAAKLRPRLATLRIDIGTGPGKRQPAFGEVTGELIQEQVARLENDLKRVGAAADVEQAHQARIALKRLRYLLEPVARRMSRARGLITRLKKAQDVLGELHDLHVLSQEIGSALKTASAGQLGAFPRAEHGLETLERLAREQAALAFQTFHSKWGGDGANRFLTRANELGRDLKAGSTRAPSEIPTLHLSEARKREGSPEVRQEDQELLV